MLKRAPKEETRAKRRERNAKRGGWIGVDFDGTLAVLVPNHVFAPQENGTPIEPMISRVRAWLYQGIEVRIVTARASDPLAVDLVL